MSADAHELTRPSLKNGLDGIYSKGMRTISDLPTTPESLDDRFSSSDSICTLCVTLIITLAHNFVSTEGRIRTLRRLKADGETIEAVSFIRVDDGIVNHDISNTLMVFSREPYANPAIG